MTIPCAIVSLGELLAEGVSKSSIRRAFSRFTCKRDSDVGFFLKAHAIQNEMTGASRTYLVVDERAFVARQSLEIVAFLTVAVTATDYTSISAEDRVKIMGRVPGVEALNYFPGYLIAQLARDDRYTHDDFDASELLPFAEDLMHTAIAAVGGRLSYLDCKPELLGYYEAQDYAPLYYDEEKGLYKLVKSLMPDSGAVRA